MNLNTSSDKVFWHGYIDYYEAYFKDREFAAIAEIGLLKGNSVRWLLERFPEAVIHGADIMDRQPGWPTDERFVFTQLDQGDATLVRRFLAQENFDLIIEDGSHLPHHQVLCLLEGMRALKSGGLYILEDVHTSHPAYPAAVPGQGNALSALLAIEHYRRLGLAVDAARAGLVAANSLLSAADVRELATHLKAISLYKRTRLPDACYACGSVDFDYSRYQCRCGTKVFSDCDSMSFVLEKH